MNQETECRSSIQVPSLDETIPADLQTATFGLG